MKKKKYDYIKKYNTIKEVVEGKITRKEASIDLDITLRQVDRLKNKYILSNGNIESFIHKQKGKISNKRISKETIEYILNLYLIEYYDFNFIAFHEELNEKYRDRIERISYSTLYNQFLNADLISPLAHKETIKLYNEKMNNAINKKINIKSEKLEFFQSRQISFEKAYIRKSSNLYTFGQEVQMDACEKKWFNDEISYLHLAVDKGTKKVLSGWFEYEEITRGYFVLLYNTIINYGIPAKIKTDNRNSFSNQNNDVSTTQFGKICNTLNIELITTSVSTAKAHVERENKTFKDRLIAEFRHENIKNIDDANKYLNEIFIPKMNNKFSYQINKDTSQMKQNNYTTQELNLIISEKFTRIIDNASSIKYKNKYYMPYNQETGEIICFMKKTECIFILTYDGEFWCEIENNYYKLVEITDRNDSMEKEKNMNKEINDNKEKIKYVPPKNHPWRKFKI